MLSFSSDLLVRCRLPSHQQKFLLVHSDMFYMTYQTSMTYQTGMTYQTSMTYQAGRLLHACIHTYMHMCDISLVLCFMWNIYIVPYNCLYNCIWFWFKIFLCWDFFEMFLYIYSYNCIMLFIPVFVLFCCWNLDVFLLFLCYICYNCVLYIAI